MRLTAVAILKWNGEKDPILFGLAADLTNFGFFQRGSVKEMLTSLHELLQKGKGDLSASVHCLTYIHLKVPLIVLLMAPTRTNKSTQRFDTWPLKLWRAEHSQDSGRPSRTRNTFAMRTIETGS